MSFQDLLNAQHLAQDRVDIPFCPGISMRIMMGKTLTVGQGVRVGTRTRHRFPVIVIRRCVDSEIYLAEFTFRALSITSCLPLSTSFTRYCGSASGITTPLVLKSAREILCGGILVDFSDGLAVA